MRIRINGTVIHVDCVRMDTWQRLACLEAAIRMQEALSWFLTDTKKPAPERAGTQKKVLSFPIIARIGLDPKVEE